ncbi:MAG: helix-turn-helix transcriptional regulator [Candidatus Bathyarchaeota archaeon]|nr:helix-turn-helix transcriptional regulator [Candidatus Bathyarchaeota archaeon]
MHELEENGLIAGKWVQKRRRRTKYYSITKEGMKLLNRLRELFEMPMKEFLKDFIIQ